MIENNVQRLRHLSYFLSKKVLLILNSKLRQVTVDKSGITISTDTNRKMIEPLMLFYLS